MLFRLPTGPAMRSLGVVCVLGMLSSDALAAPYEGKRFTYHQPDGSTFTVRLWGDEFLAYQETEEGYLVKRDPKSGVFCYARTTKNGTDIVSTGVKVGRRIPRGLLRRQRLSPNGERSKGKAMRDLFGVDQRGRLKPVMKEKLFPAGGNASGGGPAPAPPSSTTTGQRVGLVLLASFPDRPGDVTITRSQIDDYCNEPDYTAFGNATSIHGYFLLQSDGKLLYNLVVTAYFTAANNRSYYTDPAISYGARAKELIQEGLEALDAAGFDFSQCDADGNGVIDGVNCFYAGNVVNGWAEGLWPHKWSSYWSGLGSDGLSGSFQYQITEIGSSLDIGTFCHENGHMLCNFPDLYSYNGNAARIQYYSLMASSGSTHPRSVDPYLKMHAGWSDVVDLDSSSHLRCSVQVDRNYVYRYRNPANSKEYFLFEVRDNTGYEGPYGGASGSVNPTAGLVVYHALETGANTYSSIFTADNPNCDYSTPYELLVVEASPPAITPWYDDPSPWSTDSFKESGVDELSDATTPALKFWSSSGRTVASGLHMHSVSADGSSMSFIAGTGALSGSQEIGLTVTSLEPTADLGANAATHEIGVFNAGAGTLSYTISNNATWMSVSAGSGTASNECDILDVDYATSSLTSGTYNATITVTDPSASNSPQTIPVALSIAAAPVITLSTNALSMALTNGTQGEAFFEVGNSGGGTMDYTLGESLSWLSLDGTSGSVAAEVDRIAVTLGVGDPSAGVYNGSIVVTSPQATNSPRSLSVTLTVIDPPARETLGVLFEFR